MTLIDRSDTSVPVTVQTRTSVGPSQAFDIVAPIDLSRIFKRWGPFPGVRGVRNQTGDWDTVGQSRNPDLTDGTASYEEITEYTANHSFAYELTGFTNALGHLIQGVRGEWTFTPDAGGTLIRWTYEFKPLHRRQILVRRVLAPLWRRYMQNSIDAAASVVEQESPA